jgi:hypothetical protein
VKNKQYHTVWTIPKSIPVTYKYRYNIFGKIFNLQNMSVHPTFRLAVLPGIMSVSTYKSAVSIYIMTIATCTKGVWMLQRQTWKYILKKIYLSTCNIQTNQCLQREDSDNKLVLNFFHGRKILKVDGRDLQNQEKNAPAGRFTCMWLVKTISWIFTTNPKSCLVHTGLLQRMKVP